MLFNSLVNSDYIRTTVVFQCVVKKHNKPNANNPKGGITEKELPIHVSNISLVTSDGKATRVGYRIEKDKKVRFSKKSGEEI